MRKQSFSVGFLGLTLAASLIGAASPSLAHADSYLGVVLGPSFVNNNLGTNFDIGGHIGTMILPAFSLGFYGTHESLSSSSVSSVGETTLAAEGNLYLTGSNAVYIGAKAGLGITSASFLGASGSQNDFVFGPALGFNIPIAPSVSIGAEGNVLWLEADQTVTFINVLGTLTLHF
jgi:hypothetical protein